MSDSLIQQAREFARFEMEREERAFQLRAQSYGAEASTPTKPGKAGKSVLEQALDAYEARAAGLDHILGTPPAPTPKAAPTAPQGPAKGILDAVMDRHEARKVYPC